MTALPPGATLAIPVHVLARQVGDETVILDLSTGTYFGLDDIGARIWQLLAEGNQLSGVIATMLQEFDVTEGQLTHDVSSLVEQLAAQGLLDVRR